MGKREEKGKGKLSVSNMKRKKGGMKMSNNNRLFNIGCELYGLLLVCLYLYLCQCLPWFVCL